MNILKHLRKDHQQISKLIGYLEKIDGGAGDPTTRKTFEELKQSLDENVRIKEDVFYPAVKKPGKTETLVEELSREHRKLNNVLSRMEKGSGDWEDNLSELKSNVKRHFQKVETELFPKAEEILSENELKNLGEKIKGSAKDAEN